MKTYLVLSILATVLLICSVIAGDSDDYYEAPACGCGVPKLPITVYYETLCPFCMKFLAEQLAPSMKKRLPYCTLSLVPYGNAKVSPNGSIQCQHGAVECDLNAWHASILQQLDIGNAVQLIGCMMTSKSNIIEECARKLNIDITGVKRCKSSNSVDSLLQPYCEQTSWVTIDGVPTVEVNYDIDEKQQEALLSNFDRAFCVMYKDYCGLRLKGCPA